MSCITLLSDLGLHDASAAIAKGVIMQYADPSPIIDISHDIMPFHTGQAAYLLATAYRHFPLGSIHVILCDLFSNTDPDLVLCKHGGHYFLSPDNGIIPLALGLQPEFV